jgi:hypothetical protein
MARLRQKRSYNSTPGVSNGYRLGVAKVSQIQSDTGLFTIWTKKFDTCDTLAIPLRGGGCRKISVECQRL